MSGLLSATGGALFGFNNQPDPENEVTIEIGGTRLFGWQSVSIMRSAEACPTQFVLQATDPDPNPSQAITVPGRDRCKVYIGSDLAITGWVDRCEIVTAPAQHEITISGRGLCEDLVDCSADLAHSPDIKNGYVNANSLYDLAQKLCKPFDINVRLAASDAGREIPGFQVAMGETVYEVLERVARYAGFLVYEDETGTLVLDRVGTDHMVSGFGMPGNIEAAASMLSAELRYSVYTIVQNTIAQFSDVNPLSGLLAEVTDTTLPRHRPLIIQSEQVIPGRDFALERAQWEKARRIGRSQALRLTCDSWRDAAGKLWQPNTLASIDAPPHKLVGKTWIIGSVIFRKGQDGTHADVTLMPPDAFNPEPATLNLFDAQITAPPPG